MEQLYDFSLGLALPLMFFFGFYFLFAKAPEKDIFENYLRSRRIMGVAMLLLAANYSVHLFLGIRFKNAGAAILMNLSTYFLCYWLFGSALTTLLDRFYITRKRMLWNICLWLLFSALSAAVQGQYSVGGIVGYCNENVITACYSSSAVTAPKPDSSRDDLKVGGIVGINEFSLIVACYSTGDVSAQGSYVGGIAGFHVNEAIACYHSGAVNGTGEAVGGIVGYNYKSDNYAGSASHCYWNGTVSTGRGIGDDQPGTGGATKVDGTTVTWQTAVDAMNAAIGEWNANNPDRQCNWRYELTGALPTLKKQ